jgi:hypothetical protein
MYEYGSDVAGVQHAKEATEKNQEIMVWMRHENVRGQYEGNENLRAFFVSHQDTDQPTLTFL